MKMTTLLFLRHALSEANGAGICCGHIDCSLIEKGHDQAQRAAAFLKQNYKISAVYASNLKRAVETAEHTAKEFGLTVVPDARFREVCVGEWEGMLWNDIIANKSAEYAAWASLQMHEGQPRPRGSESYEQVLARLNDGIQAVISQNAGKCVAIFSHGKALRILNEQWAQTDEMAETFRQNGCKSQYLGFRSASLIAAEYTDDGAFVRLVECGRYDYLMDDNLKIATE